MATTKGELNKDLGRFQFDVQPRQAQVQQLQDNNRIAAEMGRQRRLAGLGMARPEPFRKQSGFSKTGGSEDTAIAIPRFYDPMEYWDLSGLPWNMADEGHRHKLHKWLRLFYATHHLIPILIDIFTRFPLVGMHFYSKDKKLTSFYEDLFLDQLKYEDFLVSLGREFWCIGEAFPLGSFNEDLGVWEREELLNPEDIVIENFPLLGASQIKVVPPEYLKRLANTKQPPKEYKQLEINFPELIPYLKREEPFPVSDVLLKQVAFKVSDWDDHGTPILLRGLRTLMHEEKLLASQDAIAERLYSPLILAKLGTQDLGGEGPWIPTGDQLDELRDEMDIALSSDFRLLVHHFALEIESVFGREQVPDLSNDFDRIQAQLMQVFGINPSMLGGGVDSQPYASSALQAEFMNQMLRTYQRFLKEHYRSRALIVAEAQEHYDYEKRGSTRVPIMEEVVVEDPETGEITLEKRHKLLVPDLEFQTFDLRDEQTERQFLQQLRAMGVPISDENLMVGVNFKFKDTLDEMQEEMIQKTVAQQMAKLQTYKICMQQGLPIPPDLKAEVESIGTETGPGGGQPAGAPPGGGPAGGIGDMGAPGSVDIGAPGGGIVMPPPPPGLGMGGVPGIPGGGPPPAAPGGIGAPAPGGGVPQVSNERRPGLTYNTHVSGIPADVIDEKIAHCQEVLADIEINKRERLLKAKQSRVAREELEEDDLPWSKDEIILIKSKYRKRFL